MTEDPEASEDTLTVEQPGGYDQLPTAVWLGGRKHGAAAPGEVVAYIALRRFGTMRLGRAIPGRAELAKDMGVSVGALDERLNGLIERGWLLITPRFRRDGQGQASNHYQLLWEPIVSEVDPRLVEHRRRVAEFEAWMGQRIAARADGDRPEGKRPRSVRSAEWDPETTALRVKFWRDREEERRRSEGGAENWAGVGEGIATGGGGAQKTGRGGAENCDPPLAENCDPPSQKTVPLETHRQQTHRREPTAPAAVAAAPGKGIATTGDALPGVDVAEQEPTLNQRVDALVKAWWDWRKENRPHTLPAQGVPAIKAIVKTAIQNGKPELLIGRAMSRLADQARAFSGGSLQTAIREVALLPDSPPEWRVFAGDDVAVSSRAAKAVEHTARNHAFIEQGRRLDEEMARRTAAGGAW